MRLPMQGADSERAPHALAGINRHMNSPRAAGLTSGLPRVMRRQRSRSVSLRSMRTKQKPRLAVAPDGAALRL